MTFNYLTPKHVNNFVFYFWKSFLTVSFVLLISTYAFSKSIVSVDEGINGEEEVICVTLWFIKNISKWLHFSCTSKNIILIILLFISGTSLNYIVM